jgi:hypothetical protein
MSILVHIKEVIVIRAFITVYINTSICEHNNSNTAEDYLNLYITSALYTKKLKTSKTSSRYHKIAPPC